MKLPTQKQAAELGMTVADLVNALLPGETVDYALPQGWVDECQAEGFDPRGCVVWHYPKQKGWLCGRPAALTVEGAQGQRHVARMRRARA